MTITALPTPPLRSDPVNFAARADTFLAALPTLQAEVNAATIAMNLNATTDTSASSVLIGTGAKTFTVTSGKSFLGGMYLLIADTAAPSTNSMFGQVTSYTTTSLVMNIISVKGSGTKTAWTISQASAGGAMAGANSDITSLTALASLNGGQLAGLRNRIINGNFDVWQRGTSFTNLSPNSFFSDRWIFGWDGSGVLSTISRQNYKVPSNGFLVSNSAARIQITNAGTSNTYKNIYQKIEGVNAFQGNTVTFSARFNPSTSLANVNISLIQFFGTGGSPSSTVGTASSNQTMTAGGVYSWTINVPSIASKTLGTNGDDSLWVVIGLPATGTYLVDIAEIQLELGSTATPFEQRPYGMELALCQRYYYRVSGESNSLLGVGQVANGTQAGIYIPFHTTMRVPPSGLEQTGVASDYRLWQANTVAVSCTAVPAHNNSTRDSAVVNTTASGLAGTSGQSTALLSIAYLGWSAEL